LLEIVEAFNNTNEWGISVSAEYQGSGDDLQDKMLTFMNTRDAPELVMVSKDQAVVYQLGEALVDMDLLVNNETWGLLPVEKDDYFPGLFNRGVSSFFNNNRLSFPIYAWVDVLFYNVDWLLELGYDSPPTTPEMFEDIACAAALQPFSGSTAGGRTGYALNVDEGRFTDWTLSFGGKAYNPGTEQYNFSSLPIIDSMTYLQNFINRLCAQVVENPGDDQVDFGRGVQLFAIASSNDIPTIRAYVDSEANFNWRVAPLPYTTPQPVMNVEEVSVSLPKTTLEGQLAGWLFLKYLTSPESQARWTQATEYLPVRTSAAGYISGAPAFMMTLDFLKYGVAEPVLPGYSLVQNLSKNALESIAAGENIETTLSELTIKANAILAEQMALIPESPDPWVEIDPDGQTVIFWHNHLDARQEAIQEIVQEFNNTNKWGITVVAENQGSYGDIFFKLLPILGTDESPNLVVAYPSHAAVYQQSDGLVDMTSLVDSAKWGLAPPDAADFFPSILNQDIFPTFGNSRLGFPVQRSTDLLYYNADWLAELGYDAPPASPDEFTRMACSAASNPFSGTASEAGVGYQIYLNASQFVDWAFAYGGDFFNENDNLYTFSDPVLVDAMTLFQKLTTDECAFISDDRTQIQTTFVEGSLLFMVDSSLQISNLSSLIAAGADFEWGVVPIPHTTPNPEQNVFGASLSIPVSTPEKELASWLFIKHFTSPEIQARWSQASHYLPVRISTPEYLGDYFDANPKYKTAFDLLIFSVVEPSLPGYDFVRQEIELGLLAVIDGADVVEILDYLENAANQILASHQLP